MQHRKNSNPLDKRVPARSSKYQHIQSVVNTGKTMKHVEIVSNQTAAKRKGELFKRIRCGTLAKILENIKRDNPNEAGPEEFKEMTDNVSIYSNALSDALSTFSVITVNTQALGITEDSEFVILDVREEDDYHHFHIKESICFPAPNITRDRIIPEVFRLRNQPDKFIIIYSWEERPGVEAAQKFALRGYENIYLLSGGINEFFVNFPEFIEGEVPELPKKPTKTTTNNR